LFLFLSIKKQFDLGIVLCYYFGRIATMYNKDIIGTKSNGLSGGRNSLLIKKVEELTLYLHKQQKEIDLLKQHVNK